MTDAVDLPALDSVERKHKGAYGELIACAWLLSQGYEVFRNISSHGLIDLIAVRDGIVDFFDVKTGSYNTKLKKKQVDIGVRAIRIRNDGTCFIDLDASKLAVSVLCGRCGTSFLPRKAAMRFCSDKCRVDSWRERRNAA